MDLGSGQASAAVRSANLMSRSSKNSMQVRGHPDLPLIVDAILNRSHLERGRRQRGWRHPLGAAEGVEGALGDPVDTIPTNVREPEIVLDVRHNREVERFPASGSKIRRVSPEGAWGEGFVKGSLC